MQPFLRRHRGDEQQAQRSGRRRARHHRRRVQGRDVIATGVGDDDGQRPTREHLDLRQCVQADRDHTVQRAQIRAFDQRLQRLKARRRLPAAEVVHQTDDAHPARAQPTVAPQQRRMRQLVLDHHVAGAQRRRQRQRVRGQRRAHRQPRQRHDIDRGALRAHRRDQVAVIDEPARHAIQAARNHERHAQPAWRHDGGPFRGR